MASSQGLGMPGLIGSTIVDVRWSVEWDRTISAARAAPRPREGIGGRWAGVGEGEAIGVLYGS